MSLRGEVNLKSKYPLEAGRRIFEGNPTIIFDGQQKHAYVIARIGDKLYKGDPLKDNWESLEKFNPGLGNGSWTLDFKRIN